MGNFDVIVSDAAPATTGNRLVDTQRSLELAEQVFRIARLFLRKDGNLVVKVFQGGEERQLLQRMKSLFRRARTFKPKASRGESRETYFLGLSFASFASKS